MCPIPYSGGKTWETQATKAVVHVLVSCHKLNPDLTVCPLCYHVVSQHPFSLDSHWIKNINSSCSLCLWVWSCHSSWFRVRIQYHRSFCLFVALGLHFCPSTLWLSQCYPLSFLPVTKTSLQLLWRGLLWPVWSITLPGQSTDVCRNYNHIKNREL